MNTLRNPQWTLKLINLHITASSMCVCDVGFEPLTPAVPLRMLRVEEQGAGGWVCPLNQHPVVLQSEK